MKRKKIISRREWRDFIMSGHFPYIRTTSELQDALYIARQSPLHQKNLELISIIFQDPDHPKKKMVCSLSNGRMQDYDFFAFAIAQTNKKYQLHTNILGDAKSVESRLVLRTVREIFFAKKRFSNYANISPADVLLQIEPKLFGEEGVCIELIWTAEEETTPGLFKVPVKIYQKLEGLNSRVMRHLPLKDLRHEAWKMKNGTGRAAVQLRTTVLPQMEAAIEWRITRDLARTQFWTNKHLSRRTYIYLRNLQTRLEKAIAEKKPLKRWKQRANKTKALAMVSALVKKKSYDKKT